MKPEKKIIAIVPVGEVEEMVPKVVAANISSHLGLDACVTPRRTHPAYALDPRKLQYDAGLILETLCESMPDGYDKVVGVLDVDLFIPIFSYVYGEARQGGTCAVVSTFRLHENQSGGQVPAALILERIAKVAMHELGHLFNLTHCRDPRCLMHFSGDLEMLDRIQPAFCRYCRAFWRSMQVQMISV
jgi:archaemetzincin